MASPSSFSSYGDHYYCYYSRNNATSPTTNDSPTSSLADTPPITAKTKKREGCGCGIVCCQCRRRRTTRSNKCRRTKNNLFFVLVMTEMTRIIALSIVLLLVMPIVIWDAYPTTTSSSSSGGSIATNMGNITSHATLFWNSILQFPVWPVVLVTLFVNAAVFVTTSRPPILPATAAADSTTASSSMSATFTTDDAPSSTTTTVMMTLANHGDDCRSRDDNKDGMARTTNNNNHIVSPKRVAVSSTNEKYRTRRRRRCYYYHDDDDNFSSFAWWKISLVISMAFSLLVITNMTLQMIVPHVLWNPFIWGGQRSRYPIYSSEDIVDSIEGACLDDEDDDDGDDDVNDDGPRVDIFSSSSLKSASSSGQTADNISLLRGIGNGNNSRGNNNNNDKQRTTRTTTTTTTTTTVTTALVSSSPLCLSENQWNELSSGKLSSLDPDDVATVKRGLRYLRNESGGLIINSLARNVADSIPALRHNMDGLSALFRKYDDDVRQQGGSSSSGNTDDTPPMRLSLVIFENDSTDGTREILRQWANDESSRPEGPRYVVDIMSCGPMNPECKLGIVDRYDVSLTLSTASGVGRLGEFRQRLMNYILTKEEYQLYTHMIVLDVDLGISISPLGLLHTLGLDNGRLATEYIVASSSRQVWPGTLGAITPPYDFSAFRPKKEESNKRVRTMHKLFCQLLPVGDRWRNLCDASSPMQLFMIQSANDVSNHGNRPYVVTSAFNGLTMYPLDLIRNRGVQAHYDAGVDGQQCEHVSFHLSLAKTMYVNPKWTMNLRPERPGGPSGWQACKTLFYAICGRPIVVTLMVLSKICLFFVIVSATWVIGTSLRSLWPFIS